MFSLFVDGGNQDCGSGDQFAYYQAAGNSIQCSGVTADLGVWHHIAISRDNSGTRRFFVDGILRNTQNSTSAPADSSGLFTLGRAGDYNGEYFSGLLDEIRISNTALYTTNFSPPTTPLSAGTNTIALWHLDEGSGQTTNDSSGNNRHGTLGSTGTANSDDPAWSTLTPTNSPGSTPTATPSPTLPPASTVTPTRTPTFTPSPTLPPASTSMSTATPTTPPQLGAKFSLRFYGHGVNDIDRVKIPLDPQRPVDVGGDFTLEFWLKANLADNPSTSASCGSFNWIYGNIIFDRDVYGAGDQSDYGVSLHQGKIRFGVGSTNSDQTICGSTNVANGQWHHIAVTRKSSNGQMRIYIDGQQDAQGTGPTGNISYRDGRSTSYPNSDPYLVIGAEKHDAGSQYPSYEGFIDEVDLSQTIRYSADFTPPSTPFIPDLNTVVLYHFNKGPVGGCTGTVQDSSGASGGPSNGVCCYGGSGSEGPVYSTDTPFGNNTLVAPVQPTATPIPPTPLPSATATTVPTATFLPTPLPTETPVITITHTPTPAPIPTDTPIIPTATDTPLPTETPTVVATQTPTTTPLPTDTPSPPPTDTPSPTDTPALTDTPAS